MGTMKIREIEQIYPLVIVSPRYNDSIVILNCNSDNSFVHDIELGEEYSYEIVKHLEESGLNFGIAKTLWEAFEDYKKRLYDGN